MKVSILSLVYNHEKYLADFFNGMLKQQFFHDYECIIGVDKSTDDSLDICKSYQSKHPSIFKIIEHTTNVGMFNNFVSVLNECSGEFIAICEGDDYWIDENKLAAQIQVLDKQKDAVICFTDIKCFDENEQKYFSNWATINTSIFSITDIITNNCISTCSVMFRKAAYNFSLSSMQNLPMVDWPFYINLLSNGNAIYINNTTAVYRMSSDGSYSKNTVLEQLKKKQLVYNYLIEQNQLVKYKNCIAINQFLNKYAIAIRLEKSDINRKLLLKEIIVGMFYHKNLLLVAKAIFKYL